MARELRIFLLDQSAELRELTRLGFDEHPGFRIVGEADDPVVGISLIAKHQPDAVVLDPARASGTEAIDRIREVAPRTAVVLHMSLSQTNGTPPVRVPGADGYVDKPAPINRLRETIRAAVLGRGFFVRHEEAVG